MNTKKKTVISMFVTFADGLNKAKEGAMRINIATLAITLMAIGSFGCNESPKTSVNPKSIETVFVEEVETGDAGVKEFAPPADCAESFGFAVKAIFAGANPDGSDRVKRIPTTGFQPAVMVDGKCVATITSGKDAGQFPEFGPGEWVTDFMSPADNDPDAKLEAPFIDVPNDGTVAEIEAKLTYEDSNVDFTEVLDILDDISDQIDWLTNGQFCGQIVSYGSTALIDVATCVVRMDGNIIDGMDDNRPTSCPEEAIWINKVSAEQHFFDVVCDEGTSYAEVDIIAGGDDPTEHTFTLATPVPDGEFCSMSTSYAFAPNLLEWRFQDELGRGDSGSCVPFTDEDLALTSLDVTDCVPTLSLLGTSTTPIEGIFLHLTVQADPDLILEAESPYTGCTITATNDTDTLAIPIALSPTDVEM